jgi:hypothetical protein
MERAKHHQELIDLTWRYAVLIGITDHEGIFADEVVETDRNRFGHLIEKNDDGLPIFYEEDAVGFMVELSGASPEECWKVLLEEWER